jgi:hypothetical protein
MRWLLRLYPAAWRERYGEEFGAVLDSQRASVGVVLDVIGGAIDAHFYPQLVTQNNPQFSTQNRNSEAKQIQGGDKMTLAMFQRCAAGGPKLTPGERRIASRLAIGTSFVMAVLYVLLTRLYRQAPAAQAMFWASFLSPNIIYAQMAYLKNRSRLAHAIVVGGGILGMYAFMVAVCFVARRL